MVQGMKFLSKKAFNPQNWSNQKRVWEREREAQQAASRARERAEQLKRERDDEELAQARGDAPRVNFLYQVPPGLDQGGDETTNDDDEGDDDAYDPTNQKKNYNDMDSFRQSSTSTHSFSNGDRFTDRDERKPAASSSSCVGDSVSFERQPGDDDAAAAFRQMLAAAAAGGTTEPAPSASSSQNTAAKSAFGFVLQGIREEKNSHDSNQPGNLSSQHKDQQHDKQGALSALEKAVGRRADGSSAAAGASLREQIQRFPSLANAPRQKGLDENHAGGVNFKPLGTQIRNVKCLKCGTWGHSRGDRECPMSGWDPFAIGTAPTSINGTTITGKQAANSTISATTRQQDYTNDRPQSPRRRYENEDSEDCRYRKYRRTRENREHSHDMKDRNGDSVVEREERRRRKKQTKRRSTSSSSDDESVSSSSSYEEDKKKKNKRRRGDEKKERQRKHKKRSRDHQRRRRHDYSSDEEEKDIARRRLECCRSIGDRRSYERTENYDGRSSTLRL